MESCANKFTVARAAVAVRALRAAVAEPFSPERADVLPVLAVVCFDVSLRLMVAVVAVRDGDAEREITGTVDREVVPRSELRLDKLRDVVGASWVVDAVRDTVDRDVAARVTDVASRTAASATLMHNSVVRIK